MSDPLISIIVPVFNAEKNLHRCIDSIIAQSFTDFELLLIDDGSNDTSGEICDEYAKKDIRIKVFHKENGGASSARNVGLEHANGEWITFCDADDFVLPDWLSNYIEILNDAEMIVQGFSTDKPLNKSTNDETLNYGINFYGNTQLALQKLFEQKILGYIFVKLFKTRIIKNNNIRFNPLFKLREDEDFVMQYLTHCNNVSCTDKIGYFYFVPDWRHKYYGDLFNLDRVSNCFKNELIINKENNNPPLYLWEYTHSLILTCKNGNLKRSQLLEYRKVMFHYFLYVDLSSFTKSIIKYDSTGFISHLLLSLIYKFR